MTCIYAGAFLLLLLLPISIQCLVRQRLACFTAHAVQGLETVSIAIQ